MLSGAILPVSAFAIEPTGQTAAETQLIAGPHLSGDALRALRPAEEFEVIEFTASLTDNDGLRELSVTLGADFVIEREGAKISIYDFRFERFLQLERDDREFTNDSLYGMWQLRWAFLQNNLWTWAIVAAAEIGDDPELTRFWIEQDNGLNYPQDTAYSVFPRPRIHVTAKSGRTTVVVGGVNVAMAEFSKIQFPSTSHASTFSAWLAWSLRFHPDVAAALVTPGALPIRIERATRERLPEASTAQTLRFLDAGLSTSKLSDLDGRNAKIPEWEPLFPHAMAALMVAAARGEAPNGPVSDDEYAAEIMKLADRGKLFDALLLALHASHLYDGCGGAYENTPLCKIVLSTARSAQTDSSSNALVEALRQDGLGSHAEAARTLMALRSKKLARPDILEIMIANTLVEAKKKDQLDDDLKREFAELPSRFQAAFERDPYDPSRYRDYYNYLYGAVTDIDGSYLVHLRAYPVIDLARSLPQRRMPTIVSSMTDIERKIRRDFPVHFPTYPNIAAAAGE